MTLQQLRYFIETAQVGSIGKAADRLFIAQPSLSTSLRDLESEVGCMLLHRTSKGTHLTHEGEDFLRYARQVVEQVNLMEERWVSKKQIRAPLTIASQRYAFVVKALLNMIENYGLETYRYHLMEGTALQVVEEVRLRRSEVGVLYLDRYNRTTIEKKMREGNLEFHMLFSPKMYALFSRNHPLADREFVEHADLLAYTRVAFEESDFNDLYSFEDIDTGKVEGALRSSIFVGDRGSMMHLLMGLDAYAVMTGPQGADLYTDRMVTVPVLTREKDDSMEMGWISEKCVPLSEQAEQYVAELIAVAAEN